MIPHPPPIALYPHGRHAYALHTLSRPYPRRGRYAQAAWCSAWARANWAAVKARYSWVMASNRQTQKETWTVKSPRRNKAKHFQKDDTT